MKIMRYIGNFFLKNISTFLGGTALLGIIALIFFFTFPFQVAEFKKISVADDVKVGSRLTYTNDYCQNVGKGVPREISRFLIPKDTENVSFVELSGNPTDETKNDAGCRISEPIKIPIDSSTPPGEYKLLVKVKYCIFPFRCIMVEGESAYFSVTQPDVATLIEQVNRDIDIINERTQTTQISNVVPRLPELKTPQQPIVEPQSPQTPPEVPTVQESNDVTVDTKVNIPLLDLDKLLNGLLQ